MLCLDAQHFLSLFSIAMPTEASIVQDLTTNHKDLQDPAAQSQLFKELMELKQSESADAFNKDLLKLNQDLHNDHLLPYFEIVDQSQSDPSGFNIKSLTGDQSKPASPPPMEETPPSGNFNGSGSGPGCSGGGSDGAGDGGDGNGEASGAGGGAVSAIADPGGDTWDGQSQGDMQLSDIAAKDLGQQLWAQTPWAGSCDNGNEGCAASVSRVLEEAGIDTGSAGVLDLSQKLQSQGWTISSGVDSAQPGDVMYGNNGGEDQHIGIVGLDRGQLVLYNNFSRDGKWHEEPLKSSYIATHFQANVRVLHPPADLATHVTPTTSGAPTQAAPSAPTAPTSTAPTSTALSAHR